MSAMMSAVQSSLRETNSSSSDEYHFVRTLGKGNFAVVKLAIHSTTKQQVAVKMIFKQRLDDESMRRARREVDIMRRVQHENVVTLYHVMESQDHLFLALQFCPLGDLYEKLVNDGKLKESLARMYMRQMTRAVRYLHDINVVHRDLKAENILLFSDVHVKLADFGFANTTTADGGASDGRFNTWCGSPPYAPPELLDGSHPYDGKMADIWSLGICLYVMVCASLPFDGATLALLREQVKKGKFRVPFFMSVSCESLIRWMLRVESERRPTIHQMEKHQWLVMREDEKEGKNEIHIENDDDEEEDDELMFRRVSRLILNQCDRDVPVSEIRTSVRERRHDNLHATFVLLKERLERRKRRRRGKEANLADEEDEMDEEMADMDLDEEQSIGGNYMLALPIASTSSSSSSSSASAHQQHLHPLYAERRTSITTGFVSRPAATTNPLFCVTPPPPQASTSTSGDGEEEDDDVMMRHMLLHDLQKLPPNFAIDANLLLRPPPSLLINQQMTSMMRRASDGSHHTSAATGSTSACDQQTAADAMTTAVITSEEAKRRASDTR